MSKVLEEALIDVITQGKMIQVHLENETVKIRMSMRPDNVSVYNGICIIKEDDTRVEFGITDDNITYNEDEYEWMIEQPGCNIFLTLD